MSKTRQRFDQSSRNMMMHFEPLNPTHSVAR